MGGPWYRGGGVVLRRHLGDKLHDLARLDPNAVRDIERLVDWKLGRLSSPTPLRVKHVLKHRRPKAG